MGDGASRKAAPSWHRSRPTGIANLRSQTLTPRARRGRPPENARKGHSRTRRRDRAESQESLARGEHRQRPAGERGHGSDAKPLEYEQEGALRQPAQGPDLVTTDRLGRWCSLLDPTHFRVRPGAGSAIVAKAEWTKGDADPRFVITSLGRGQCKTKPIGERSAARAATYRTGAGMPVRPLCRPHLDCHHAGQPKSP
jgi:hypothetical protein